MPKEQPSPTLADVLAKAKNKQEIDLTKDELQDLAQDKTVEEAKVQLDTRDQLNHLSGELKEERMKNGLEEKSNNPDLGLAQELASVERRIDEHALTLDPVVLDIKTEEAEKPGALNTIKKLASGGFFKTVGGLLRALSGIMKILPGSVLGINAGQLNFFEGIYNKMFGPSDARGQAAEGLKDSGVVIREGTQDSLAYGMLHTKYEAALRGKLGMDAGGKTEKSQVEQDLLKQGFSFEKFVQEEARAYGAKHGGAVGGGKEKATTLMGIAKGSAPAEVQAANDPKAAPTEEKNRAIATETLDLKTIPEKKNLLASVDLNDAALTEKRLELASGGMKITVLPPVNEEGLLEMRVLIDGVAYSVAPKNELFGGALRNTVLKALGIAKTDKGIDGRSALRAAKNGMTVERVGDVIRASIPGIADMDVPLADVENAIKAAKGKASAEFELNVTQSVVLTKQTYRETFIATKI